MTKVAGHNLNFPTPQFRVWLSRCLPCTRWGWQVKSSGFSREVTGMVPLGVLRHFMDAQSPQGQVPQGRARLTVCPDTSAPGSPPNNEGSQLASP